MIITNSLILCHLLLFKRKKYNPLNYVFIQKKENMIEFVPEV